MLKKKSGKKASKSSQESSREPSRQNPTRPPSERDLEIVQTRLAGLTTEPGPQSTVLSYASQSPQLQGLSSSPRPAREISQSREYSPCIVCNNRHSPTKCPAATGHISETDLRTFGQLDESEDNSSAGLETYGYGGPNSPPSLARTRPRRGEGHEQSRRDGAG